MTGDLFDVREMESHEERLAPGAVVLRRFAVPEEAGPGVLTLVRSGNTNAAFTVQYATADGTGPKAATLALMRQYAIDYGSQGIRANGVNADRVRTGLLTDAMVAQRAQARGVSEADYMGGNLLKREVTADDVAQAFVALAKARATTGHIETVDGGNIAAALR
jgi:NAD(P)-dependent dehydrogenase (short-subunit alcohol dehydrogenase family)